MNLRRTITPYVGQMLIVAGVTVFLASVAYGKSELGLLWGLLFWAPFAAYVGIALKYRVLWNETGVIMRASGGGERYIPFTEISEIRTEVADRSEWLAQSRPFRRIVIRGHRHDPNAIIDVSLRHFRLEDIESLMKAIHRHRPDLTVPRVQVPR